MDWMNALGHPIWASVLGGHYSPAANCALGLAGRRTACPQCRE
jgi:hypothetical protein